jgi:N utilization substance protein A
MTPEQLEEIPGIGEKTLERISVAVRHYFGHFEEGEEGHVPAADETDGTDESEASPNSADIPEGASEVETPEVVADAAEAESENAQVVLEEAESVNAAAENDELNSAARDNEALLEEEPEDQGLTAAELSVDSVPPADDVELPELEAEQRAIGTTKENEEDGA